MIASCTVVPDSDATVDFAYRLHRALVDDEEPAAALAQARVAHRRSVRSPQRP